MMASRYEAYKNIVVKPFFREHFARIDRQIVLVDALQALNAGGAAVADLETALSEILACFNHGKRSWLTSLFSPHAQTKFYSRRQRPITLHHKNHDRLEAILSKLVERAATRAMFSGAKTDVIALAAIRATSEAEISEGSEKLPVIVGTPLAGETMDKQVFDGNTRTAVFFLAIYPLIQSKYWIQSANRAICVFFASKPPELEKTAEGVTLSLPHIRLDRAMEFLLGDKLQ